MDVSHIRHHLPSPSADDDAASLLHQPTADATGADDALPYEKVLDRVGTGAFQNAMLLVFGLGNASDAIEILCISLVLPIAGEELGLSASDRGLLSSCIFVGMLVGGLSWGLCGDVAGRRMAFILAMALNAAGALASSFAPSFAWLVALRTIAGIGVGGSVPIVFSFFAELLPTSTRGLYMVLLASSWAAGSILSAASGWAIIPSLGWRAFVAFSAAPSALCAVLVSVCVPESPRHLLAKGRPEAALCVLRAAAVFNGRPLPEELRLMPLMTTSWQAAPGSGAWALYVAPQLNQAKHLFVPPLLPLTVCLSFVWFSLCAGWYGILIWLPTFFLRGGGGSGLSVYADTLLVALANIPGNVLSAYSVDGIGRRKTLAFSMGAACGCSLLFAALPPGAVWSVVAACVFNGVSVGGWNSLDLITAEAFPTPVRTSAFGWLGAVGRAGSAIGGIVMGALSTTTGLFAPLAVAASCLAVASVAAFFLPVETQGRALVDDTGEPSQEP